MNQRSVFLGCLLTWAACVSVGDAQEPAATPPAVPPVNSAEKTATPTLPAKYEADRFFVEPITENMIGLRFLASTGDNNLIYSDVAAGLGVPIALQGNSSAIYFPDFNPEHAIPPPLGSEGRMPIKPKRLRRADLGNRCSGILGQDWFAGRIWTLDYPAQKLILREANDVPRVPTEHRTTLGFRTEGMGRRTGHLPRVVIKIAGESISMLLNTGATVTLSDETVKTLADGKDAIRAASFITDIRLAAWRKAHSWRVIEKAERGGTGTMIEVPKITIAGYEVGPVWFTARPVGLYRNQISRRLDARVDGAIGGNLLKSFRVTLDYPNATAYFVKP